MPSANVVLLDTHIWLDVALGRQRGMGARVMRKLDRGAAAGSLYVAAITPRGSGDPCACCLTP